MFWHVRIFIWSRSQIKLCSKSINSDKSKRQCSKINIKISFNILVKPNYQFSIPVHRFLELSCIIYWCRLFATKRWFLWIGRIKRLSKCFVLDKNKQNIKSKTQRNKVPLKINLICVMQQTIPRSKRIVRDFFAN